MSETIGENLVGSYLRYVRECHFVVYNTYLPDMQGEIDVIGVRLSVPQEVWLCEVVTHIRGLQYGTYAKTIQRVQDKIKRAREFANTMFPYGHHYFEIWSPVVPKGKLTKNFNDLEAEYTSKDMDVKFIINQNYTAKIQELVEHARQNTAATSEPAYRLLQILTRLRGDFTV